MFNLVLYIIYILSLNSLKFFINNKDYFGSFGKQNKKHVLKLTTHGYVQYAGRTLQLT